MRLEVGLSQKQILSQHMIQSMEMLQMSALELDAYLENMALENPLMDVQEIYEEDNFFKQQKVCRKQEWMESTDYQNHSYYQWEKDADDMEKNWHDRRDMEEELGEYLLSQILLTDYSDLDRALMEAIILSLDGRGYFVEDVAYFAKEYHVPEEYVLRLLGDVQKLDPAGVGARNLRECLLLQLERREVVSEYAVRIVSDYLEELGKNHLAAIAKGLSCTMDDVLEACDVIRKLNPKPGNAFSDRTLMNYVVPDVVVVQFEDRFEILINEYRHSHFQINEYYKNLLKTTTNKETQKYLQEKLSQAEQAQYGINMRTSTLTNVVRVLVEYQMDFFLHGIGHKRPMKLSELAEKVGVHESTISRTLRGKYLQCTWGVFALNYFLTSVAVKASVGVSEMTPEQVKGLIQNIIDGEDKKKPFSDQKIADKLKELNADISRRTVNKYRMEMGIPDKSGRKEW